MGDSYYNGSQRCEDCGELKEDVKERDAFGQTAVLCGSCYMEIVVQERSNSQN